MSPAAWEWLCNPCVSTCQARALTYVQTVRRTRFAVSAKLSNLYVVLSFRLRRPGLPI